MSTNDELSDLYIRVRGRVQGPFDKEKLSQLVRRGQLSRVHEVSLDGVRWQKASEYPALFTSALASKTTSQAKAGEERIQVSATPPSPKAGEWYYSQGDANQGPFDLQTIKLLALQSMISPETLIWRDGMSDWMPASSISELSSIFQRPVVSMQRDTEVNANTRREETPQEVIRLLEDSRSWLSFISACAYLFTASLWVSGILLLIAGFNTNAIPSIAFGLMSIAYGGVTVTAGILVRRYNSRIGRLIDLKSEFSLTEVLRALRSIWTYCGIVLVVITFNAFILGIWMFSIFSAAFKQAMTN